MLETFHGHLVLIAEDVEVGPVGRGELGAIDGLDLGEHRLTMVLPSLQRGQADIVPLVVPAQVAKARRHQRALGQFPVPFAIE